MATTTPVVHSLGAVPELARIFPALRGMAHPVLLESAVPTVTSGRYSYLTADPFLVARSRGSRVTVEEGGVQRHVDGNPWDVLQDLLRRYHTTKSPGLPPFQGGAVGYFAYDLGRFIERLPTLTKDDIGLPEMAVGLYDWAIAHDAATGQTWLVSTGLPDGSTARADARARQVLRRLELTPPVPEPWAQTVPLRSNFTQRAYLAAVRRVKAYLEAGDVYQVNLSQRFEGPFSGDPWSLYLRLRQANPAPFAAYLSFPEVAVLSASPELFLRLEDGRVETRPIKGTRPRGSSPGEDQRLAAELLASPKERAENIMIVDLLRSDLGRVCRVGTVQVPSLFAVEPHPTVWHLESTVTGELREGADAVDLLRACFPGGSVTGAPKVRAMEIIEELEPVRRGIYCGALGYLSFTGDMATSIVIRTLVLAGGRLYLQVGGGIVADSDPEAEYRETLYKAKGLRRALGRGTRD